MDQTLKYAEILTQVLREKSKTKYKLQPRLKLVASCDRESGQFLLVKLGWDREHWVHQIIFHAQFVGNKIVIEADQTEGLKPLLLEAGIPPEAFLSDQERDRMEEEKFAA
ncbi:MAG TPA: element excision factor XisI family protein [Blastocatellia bacterium]|nr:element excision factor XisI family protein [Blastocatellia bacterium]